MSSGGSGRLGGTARVQRLNYDHTLTPTKLLHMGIGYQTDYFTDDTATVNYDAEKNLGLKGATNNRIFPTFKSRRICAPIP